MTSRYSSCMLYILPLVLLLLVSSKCHGRARSLELRGGSLDAFSTAGDKDQPSDKIYLRGVDDSKITGIVRGEYLRTEWTLNGRAHYERSVKGDYRGEKLHLYFSGNQWIIHFDTDPSQNFDNMVAYAKSRASNPLKTSSLWQVKVGTIYEAHPELHMHLSVDIGSKDDISKKNVAVLDEFLGVPKRLVPLFFAFMLDGIAVGLVLPLMPFYIMELGANAFQLSLVISATYVAQMIGCIIVGQLNDQYGRRPHVLACLFTSCASHFLASKSTTLTGVALSRILSGSCGGMVPALQACVGDVSPQELRPKYLGRIVATFGIGFMIGPMLSKFLAHVSTRDKLRFASALPLLGFIIIFTMLKETKEFNGFQQVSADKKLSNAVAVNTKNGNVSMDSTVMLLVLNGFLCMYAFSTESIYAIFLKDSFGYGESVLSALLACTGAIIGFIQIFCIRSLVSAIGKHATLGFGNILLALGMLGVASVRQQHLHFTLFAIHIIGFSLADTALACLISRYSSPSSHGRDLAFNQAAQSCAKVLSPLVAGFLYERGKRIDSLPVGALPFLVGSLFPAAAITIPSLLYIRSISRKAKNKTIKEEVRFN